MREGPDGRREATASCVFQRQGTTVNYLPLATGADAVPGRFDLYPTEYVRTYILLDVLDGRTWQVVWSYDGTGELFPINNLPSKYY